MSEENTGTESQDTEGGAQAEETVPKRKFSELVDQRNALKAKLREFEAERAQAEAERIEAEKAEMEKRGEFEKLLEKERADKADLLAKIAERDRKERFGRTADAVSKKAGIDLALAEALLLREEAISGADVALEEVTDDAVVDLAKRLRNAAPSLFTTEGKGGSPGIPGLNMANKKPGESNLDSGKARAQRIAKALSNA